MAVFEGKSGVQIIDDTIAFACSIEAAHAVGDHTEYVMRVHRIPDSQNNWCVKKRYSDFDVLDAALKAFGLEFPLPPKKVFGNRDREFVAERQQGLHNYVNEILKIHMVASCHQMRSFLDPSTYSFNIKEKALQHISMLFRSENRWEVVEPAPDIGWRIRKAFFFVKDITQPKTKYLLSWTNLGPVLHMENKDLTAVSKLLIAFKHPHVYPVSMCEWNETCCISVSNYSEKGTLRDSICKSKPKAAFLKKYGKPKTYCICGLDAVRSYGRQILETLKFLHDKGIPYGNLHAGNVMLVGKVCQLMDIHSWFVGCPSYYKPFIIQHKKIQTVEDIDVYSFGHLLYEMSMGVQLNEETCDNAPLNCPPEIRSVIQSILSGDACRNGLPSLTDLLAHSLFNNVVTSYEKPQLKLTSKLKECLKEAKARFEKNLKSEQKVLHQHRRLSKAKEFHMSDEEKRKRRRSKIKQLSQQASEDQDVYLQTPTSPTAPVSPMSTTSPGSTTSPRSSTISEASSPLSGKAESEGGSDVPPVPVPPPVLAPPSPPPVIQNGTGDDPKERTALLGSIRDFSKMGLKKAEINDKSKAKV